MSRLTAPTRREVALFISLLVLFLLFFQIDFSFRLVNLHPTSSEFEIDSSTLRDDFEALKGWVKGHGRWHHGQMGAATSTGVVWGDDLVPPSTIVSHVPGWTVIDNMYIQNGTVYIVTDDPQSVPDRRLITSSGYQVLNGDEEVARREPTDKDLRVISRAEARRLFGKSASRIDGPSFVVNDPPQFITHYYHFSAELLFGLWRTYSSLDPAISTDGHTSLPPPRRLMFTHTPTWNWRDYASMNQYILRGAFPSISLEFSDDWADRAAMPTKAFVFDRAVFADRAAAMRGSNFLATARTASEAFGLPGSKHWWSTIRNNIVTFSGLKREAGSGTRSTPVITYVSRQEWGRRMLKPEDHEALVAALMDLKERYGYEVNVVSMDKLSREEQIQLAGRTTVLMGVHGNGLTSLLWMQPTPRATVIEFFYPGGFAYDYEYTTRALGMMHYGFWGSQYFTSPNLPPMAYPEGFQGNEIPIDGAEVARLVHSRLSLEEELDD